MPSFYFNLCNGSGYVRDEEGQRLSDVPAAREMAIRSLRDVLAHEVREGRFNAASFIEIEDEQRRHVATVRVAEAIKFSNTVAQEPRSIE